MRADIRKQVLYPETVDDADIVIPGKRKFTPRPEDVVQVECVRWIRKQPHLRYLVHQPERIQNIAPWQRDRLKALGIFGNRGAVELVILDSRERGRAWWIELKAKRGRASEEQIGWQAWLEQHGYRWAMVRSLDELVAVIG